MKKYMNNLIILFSLYLYALYKSEKKKKETFSLYCSFSLITTYIFILIYFYLFSKRDFSTIIISH